MSHEAFSYHNDFADVFIQSKHSCFCVNYFLVSQFCDNDKSRLETENVNFVTKFVMSYKTLYG